MVEFGGEMDDWVGAGEETAGCGDHEGWEGVVFWEGVVEDFEGCWKLWESVLDGA